MPKTETQQKGFWRHHLYPTGWHLAFLICTFLSATCQAEPYSSAGNHFSVSYDAPWSRISLPDPTAELFITCNPSVCGPGVLISFGAFFDGHLRSGKLADFLKQAKGDVIFQTIKTSPMVSKVTILREGRVRIGSTEAYEVLAELVLNNGLRRMRHTFMTFNAGYMYNISLGSPPDAHAKALAIAKPVFDSFKFK